MRKRFVFICGDIGGANYQLPAIKLLIQLGHEVSVFADSNGMAQNVFQAASIPFKTVLRSYELDVLAREVDLFFINTCASASQLAIDVLSDLAAPGPDLYKAKIVIGSDGLFNYGFSKWLGAVSCANSWRAKTHWFAINEGHAKAIGESHPRLKSENISIVGQPAFDGVLDYIPRKQEVRRQTRRRLGLSDSSTFLLWWSQGMLDVISEDVCMLLHGLERFRNSSDNIFLAPRIHPKLNKTVSAEYTDEIKRLLYFSTSGTRIQIVDADDIKPEELCLASDVILSVTCTEDIKNVMMGGPPVVHFVGPLARRWFEKELNQKSPYLPDIRSGQSLVAWSADEVGLMIKMALNPEIKKSYLKNWKQPTGLATKKVADKLVEIAQI